MNEGIRQTIIEKIEKKLLSFDRIFLIVECEDGKGNESNSLTAKFLGSIADMEIKKNIAVLSTITISMLPNNVVYQKISKKEQKELLEFYYLYEFSDRFRILSRGKQYGTIFHYVDAGILTLDEVFFVMVG